MPLDRLAANDVRAGGRIAAISFCAVSAYTDRCAVLAVHCGLTAMSRKDRRKSSNVPLSHAWYR